MRHILLIVALLPALAAPRAALTAQPAATPRLLVVVVVDQMRADYLRLFERHWRGGFRTLLDEGLVFDNARLPYANTETCPGHATIGTGTLPRTHGMVMNAWWHRDLRRSLPCVVDPAMPDISYGRPVQSGSSPARIAVPTLADELRAQSAGARVVSVSLKARSAIGLAGRGGDAVVWFDDASGSFATSRAYAKAPVSEVKAFVDQHPYERDQGKSWTLHGSADSYRYPDAGVGERPPAPWTGLFPHPIAGRANLDALFFDIWQTSPFADAYLARMALALVDSFALGQRTATDFLGISFSSTDEVGHDFGPESREVEDVLRHLDVTLATVIERLDARVGRVNYVLALTADHGVPEIGGYGRGGRVVIQDVVERMEETLSPQFGVPAGGRYVDNASFSQIYLAPGIAERLKSAPAAMTALRRSIEDLPGVHALLSPDQLNAQSGDAAIRSGALSYFAGRSGDLLVVPEENWYLHGRNPANATTHGSHYDYDAHVPLILLGGGIARGRTAAAATPADIAPTLAARAGVRMAKAEGRNLVR